MPNVIPQHIFVTAGVMVCINVEVGYLFELLYSNSEIRFTALCWRTDVKRLKHKFIKLNTDTGEQCIVSKQHLAHEMHSYRHT